MYKIHTEPQLRGLFRPIDKLLRANMNRERTVNSQWEFDCPKKGISTYRRFWLMHQLRENVIFIIQNSQSVGYTSNLWDFIHPNLLTDELWFWRVKQDPGLLYLKYVPKTLRICETVIDQLPNYFCHAEVQTEEMAIKAVRHDYENLKYVKKQDPENNLGNLKKIGKSPEMDTCVCPTEFGTFTKGMLSLKIIS